MTGNENAAKNNRQDLTKRQVNMNDGGQWVVDPSFINKTPEMSVRKPKDDGYLNIEVLVSSKKMMALQSSNQSNNKITAAQYELMRNSPYASKSSIRSKTVSPPRPQYRVMQPGNYSAKQNMGLSERNKAEPITKSEWSDNEQYARELKVPSIVPSQK